MACDVRQRCGKRPDGLEAEDYNWRRSLHGRGAPLVVGNVTGSLPVNVR